MVGKEPPEKQVSFKGKKVHTRPQLMNKEEFRSSLNPSLCSLAAIDIENSCSLGQGHGVVVSEVLMCAADESAHSAQGYSNCTIYLQTLKINLP